MWGDIAIAFLLAFIVTFMATPYTIKIACCRCSERSKKNA